MCAFGKILLLTSIGVGAGCGGGSGSGSGTDEVLDIRYGLMMMLFTLFYQLCIWYTKIPSTSK